MTATAERAATSAGAQTPRATMGQLAVRYLTTTDHKVIGNLYLVTSFVFFLLACVMALVIRAELAYPRTQIVSY